MLVYLFTYCSPFISRVSFVMLLTGAEKEKNRLKAWLFSHSVEAERRNSFFTLPLLISLHPHPTIPFPAAAGTHIGDVCLQLQHLHHFLPHVVVILSQVPVLSGYLRNRNHEMEVGLANLRYSHKQ